MDEMYRMLGREHEADLLREAERLQRPVTLGLPATPKRRLRPIVLRVFRRGKKRRPLVAGPPEHAS